MGDGVAVAVEAPVSADPEQATSTSAAIIESSPITYRFMRALISDILHQ